MSPEGAGVPFTISKNGTNLAFQFSESTGATKYNVYPGSLANLRQGIYDHASACALEDRRLCLDAAYEREPATLAASLWDEAASA